MVSNPIFPACVFVVLHVVFFPFDEGAAVDGYAERYPVVDPEKIHYRSLHPHIDCARRHLFS